MKNFRPPTTLQPATFSAPADSEFDFVVIGSGFAGSLIATILQTQGRRVAIVDRSSHPRFAIGESSTPAASLILSSLADHYDLSQHHDRLQTRLQLFPPQTRHAVPAESRPFQRTTRRRQFERRTFRYSVAPLRRRRFLLQESSRVRRRCVRKLGDHHTAPQPDRLVCRVQRSHSTRHSPSKVVRRIPDRRQRSRTGSRPTPWHRRSLRPTRDQLTSDLCPRHRPA